MQISESRLITAEPDLVWKIGGDTANVADWIPALETSSQRGDLRHATFADGGGEAIERIVEHNDSQRSYTYEYISGPLQLRSYLSTFAVNVHPDGAQVTWDAEFETASAEDDAALAQAIAGIYRAALGELANHVAATQN
jgi:hypothetical protein